MLGTHCDNSKGWPPWPEACVERESVHVIGMHLQYTTGSYTYKYDSKYAAMYI